MRLRWLTRSPSIALTMMRLPNYTVNKIVLVKSLLNFHHQLPFTIYLSSLIFHYFITVINELVNTGLGTNRLGSVSTLSTGDR